LIGTTAKETTMKATEQPIELATPDEQGAAIAGDFSTAICDVQEGLAVAGECGVAIASDEFGVAAAGDGGLIALAYWDKTTARVRLKIGYVGEDGILPNVAYALDDNHEFFAI
jgi:hypothetical protein